MYVLFLAPLVRVSWNSLYSSPLAGRLLAASVPLQGASPSIAALLVACQQTRPDKTPRRWQLIPNRATIYRVCPEDGRMVRVRGAISHRRHMT